MNLTEDKDVFDPFALGKRRLFFALMFQERGIIAIGFQIIFLARLEGASLRKAYCSYVAEGKRLITQPKNCI